jgi:hypothetical protein
MEFVLMRHSVHGGEARWAEGAVDHAKTLGWRVVKPAKTRNVPDTGPDTPADVPETPEKEPDTGRNEE